MGTGISRLRLAITATVLGVAVMALVLGGCGSGGSTSSFGWLHPTPPPADWRVVTIPSGAALAYPPSWRTEHGDKGTATVALLNADGRFLGYLNVTPRQGDETVSNWSSFRIEHNTEEGDRGVKRLGFATALRFLTGRGACVKDSYTTRVDTHFVEVACLVNGARAQTVIVAAAPPGSWAKESAVLERAIEGIKS